jgi:uncharacterized protein with NRDE domain
MCTLIVATRAWSATPLLVAANRDENLERPSAGPNVRVLDPIPVLAPMDLRAGGTWIGISAMGVFAGVTNRFGQAPDPDRQSRGGLVPLALSAAHASIGAERVATIDPRSMNPFHLVVADRHSAYLVWHDGRRVLRRPLDAGVHAITERSFGAAPTAREERLQQHIRLWGDRRPPSIETLIEVLSEHNADPMAATCVHASSHNYGTRSSTIIRLPQSNEGIRYLHAEGSPCRNELVDLSPQLRSLMSWQPPG